MFILMCQLDADDTTPNLSVYCGFYTTFDKAMSSMYDIIEAKKIETNQEIDKDNFLIFESKLNEPCVQYDSNCRVNLLI